MKKALVGVLAVLVAAAMAPVAVAVAVAASASASAQHVPFTDKDLESEESMWSLYERWRSVHTSSLDLAEKERRFEAFMANARYVNEFSKEGMTYKLGLNKFADMTFEEFVAKYTGAKVDAAAAAAAMAWAPEAEEELELELAGDVPAAWDWRQHGAVTAVKNQGHCESRWAFSAVGAVEGANAIATGQLVTLSEQQVLDCSGAGDCSAGGVSSTVLRGYAVKPGISPARSYPPYEAKEQACRRAPVSVVKMDGGAVDVPVNEAAFKRSVYRNSSLGGHRIHPKLPALPGGHVQWAVWGIARPCVLAVGYSMTRDNIKYWIVKNSWKIDWGENGYIRMKRDVAAKEGLCGIVIFGMYSIKNGHKNALTLQLMLVSSPTSFKIKINAMVHIDVAWG